MNNSKDRNYLPKNYQELLTRYRKVPPVVLETNHPASPKRSALATGLEVYSGEWGDVQKLHLLRRTLFGTRQKDLEALAGLDVSQAVDLLLTKGTVTLPVNNYNDPANGVEDPEIAFGETWINSAYGDQYEGPRTNSLKGWLIKNMLNQDTSVEEKMLLFWHNLLPIQTWGVFYAKLSYRYFEMLRRNLFGNFKTMIKELTLDPAMLLYLNGTFNNKEAPDENYGRELQELFCIGKGPNANFTEEDVQAAARVLTGWVVRWEDFEASGILPSYFYSPFHDTTNKQFSAFYGNRVILGRTGEAGAEELDELLDMIFDNNETALYLCRRLYQFFVYPEIDAAAESQVIEPLANILRTNDYEVKPVLEALFKSAHFHDEANWGAIIKSPTEYVLGLWRTLEVEGVDPEDLLLGYTQHNSFLWNMANLGMEIGDPPSVSGWPAYYQTPSYDKYWLTTDTIANRAIASDSLVYWGFWIKEGVQIPADLIKFISGLNHPEDPNQMLLESSRLLLGMELDTEMLNNLKSILLSGQQTDSYWSTAWGELTENPDDEEYRMVVENRLKPTFQHLLQLGEAQLM